MRDGRGALSETIETVSLRTEKMLSMFWLRNKNVPQPDRTDVVRAGTVPETVLVRSLLYGINDGILRRVQSVQNAVARLVIGARRCGHVTPLLRQLHWLPVRQQIILKMVGLVHQLLAGIAPAYLAEDCR